MTLSMPTEPGTRLGERFVQACGLAIELHGDQVRKGSDITYVSHLLGVASIVLEYGGSEDQAIAALLHDAIEDSDDGVAVEAQIAAEFGADVARIVRDCSDSKTKPKPPWRERKERYIEHVATAPLESLLVSCADKLYNARAILADLRTHGPLFFEQAGFKAGAADQCWYYRSLADCFTARLGSLEPQRVLARELDAVVTEIERLIER